MDQKLKGIICGIIAAVCYGTNPLGALFLYHDGINVDTVLFFRYTIAALILCSILLLRKESFSISLKEFFTLGLLGILFASSSLTLFMSFNYMDAGIASTLLFVYPVMVAVIMSVFFKEKITLTTVLSVTLALAGIALLYKSNGNTTLNAFGVLLVMISSLTYAFYIIVVNKSKMKMSPIKLTLFVLPFCILTVVAHSFLSPEYHLQMLSTSTSWSFAIMLAIVPTVISLVMMAKSVQLVGSTPAAITGAFEPMTAVIIGVFVFNEAFTFRLGLGIVTILAAVIIIVVGNNSSVSLKKRFKISSIFCFIKKLNYKK